MKAADAEEWIVGAGFAALVGAVCLSVLTFLIVAVTMSARSSGSPDYCYVSVYSKEGAVIPTYRLYAHRPWSSDTMAGVFSSFDEAVAAGNRMTCPFKEQAQP